MTMKKIASQVDGIIIAIQSVFHYMCLLSFLALIWYTQLMMTL